MARVRLEGVTKELGKKRVLEGINLTVEDRSFTTILGPPGAGKTTLLRIIAGLEMPDEGRVFIGDKDVTEMMPRDRGVSMVFQDLVLYPHMSVYDNVAYPLKLRKIPKKEIKERVKEVTDFLKIGSLLEREPTELSGGEMQRLAIARAIVRKSDIYLFDEPLTNLDYKLREDMRGEFKRMRIELGGTIIYSTPDPVDALAMSDSVAAINNGRIEQYGSVSDLYEHPKNVYVGSYFGYPAMNIVDCSLVREGDKFLLDTGFFEIDVTPLKKKLSGASAELILGLRPEYLRMSAETPKEGVSLKAEAFLGEVIGSDTILHAKIGDYPIKLFLPGIHRLERSKEIWISFDLDRIHLFDKKTGGTII